MSEIKAASRYAKSLIDLSVELNSLEEMRNDMVLIEQVITKNSELEAVLSNPIIPLNKKAGILTNLFEAQVHKATKTFIQLVVSKGRSSILFETAKQFVIQYNQIKGIVSADVVSAVELTEANRTEIVTLVKAQVAGAKEVLLKEKVDPNLIGGFVLTVGDRQFDASISSSLNKLKKEFAQGVA
jgi:F-type H+-transporting ATPase subunit delta